MDLFNISLITPNVVNELTSQLQKQLRSAFTNKEYINVTEEVKNKAKFAKMSYNEEKKRDYYHQGYMLLPEFSTTYNALYYSPKKKEFVYSIRGTDFENIRDLKSDIGILNKDYRKNERFVSEKQRIKTLVNRYGKDHKIHLTGHSLGGKIITDVMGDPNISKYIESAHAFNPGQATEDYLMEELIDPGENLQIHLMDTDPISINYGYEPNSIGEIHHYKNSDYTFTNAHKIDSFI